MDLLRLSSSLVAEVQVGPIHLSGWTFVDLDIRAELELSRLVLCRLDVLSLHKQSLAISVDNRSLRGLPQVSGICSSLSLIVVILSFLSGVRILLSNQVDNRFLHSILLCELPDIRLRWELVHAL